MSTKHLRAAAAPHDDLLQVRVAPLDKVLLRLLARLDGDAGMSATVRRLIRSEARRRRLMPAAPGASRPAG